jgi:hypothetical protein
MAINYGSIVALSELIDTKGKSIIIIPQMNEDSRTSAIRYRQAPPTLL